MKTTTHFKRFVTGTVAICVMLCATAINASPYTEFPLSDGSHPVGIVTGPDGNLWFTEEVGRVGRMRPDGSLTQFFTPGTGLEQITDGPDRSVWFVEATSLKIGRIQMDGTTTEFPTLCSPIGFIVGGPNNSVWFPEVCAGGDEIISEMATLGAAAGTIKKHALSTGIRRSISSITTGADGNLWFADNFRGSVTRLNTASGVFSEFTVLGATPNTLSFVIRGPDNKIWTSFNETIARISVNGDVEEFELPDESEPVTLGTTMPDGSVWGVDNFSLLRFVATPSGISSSRYAAPTGSNVLFMASGPDRNLWFSDHANNVIDRIPPDVVFFDGLGDKP